MAARNRWYCRQRSPGAVPSPLRKLPRGEHGMPVVAAPSRKRNAPDKASRRAWMGRSGSPMTSVTLSAGEAMLAAAISASAAPHTALSGNSTRAISLRLSGRITPQMPMPSHNARTTREADSGDSKMGMSVDSTSWPTGPPPRSTEPRPRLSPPPIRPADAGCPAEGRPSRR